MSERTPQQIADEIATRFFGRVRHATVERYAVRALLARHEWSATYARCPHRYHKTHSAAETCCAREQERRPELPWEIHAYWESIQRRY